jgi:hypothetical protein
MKLQVSRYKNAIVSQFRLMALLTVKQEDALNARSESTTLKATDGILSKTP